MKERDERRPMAAPHPSSFIPHLSSFILHPSSLILHLWSSCRINGGPRRQQLSHGAVDFVDRKISHAAMVAQWAGAPLAGNTLQLVLQMDRLRMIILAQSDVRRTEQRDDGHSKSGREMPGAAVGCHHGGGASHAGLAEPDAQRLVRQT